VFIGIFEALSLYWHSILLLLIDFWNHFSKLKIFGLTKFLFTFFNFLLFLLFLYFFKYWGGGRWFAYCRGTGTTTAAAATGHFMDGWRKKVVATGHFMDDWRKKVAATGIDQPTGKQPPEHWPPDGQTAPLPRAPTSRNSFRCRFRCEKSFKYARDLKRHLQWHVKWARGQTIGVRPVKTK
jgi:hypothetical protein